MWLWEHLDLLFFGPRSQRATAGGALLRVLRYPYAITRDLLASGEITLRAMSLVFATLLALIPLLALTFALLKGRGPHKALEPLIEEFFQPLGPGSAEITASVMQFADHLRNSVVGGLGIVLLVWSLLAATKKVEDSFNFVWRVEQARGFGRRVAEYLALLVIGPALLVGFIELTRNAIASEPVQLVTQVPLAGRLLHHALRLAPYVAATALFTTLYVLVPHTRVRLRPALIGGICAGIAWAVVGKVFAGIVLHSARLTLVYASFAVVVALPTWTYLSWLILLAGAQLSFYVQYPSYLRLGLKELRLSCSERERLALTLAGLIAQRELEGGPRWSNESLARKLALPGVVISRTTASLLHSHILTCTPAYELALARDPDAIRVLEVLEAVRRERWEPSVSAADFPLPTAHLPGVDAVTSHLEDASRACCAERTLRDLAQSG
jgi:membrane protein